MVKTTVYLPEHLKRSIERLAAERGMSEADVIRSALESHVHKNRPRPSFGLFESGDPTLVDRVDEILAEGFGEW